MLLYDGQCQQLASVVRWGRYLVISAQRHKEITDLARSFRAVRKDLDQHLAGESDKYLEVVGAEILAGALEGWTLILSNNSVQKAYIADEDADFWLTPRALSLLARQLDRVRENLQDPSDPEVLKSSGRTLLVFLNQALDSASSKPIPEGSSSDYLSTVQRARLIFESLYSKLKRAELDETVAAAEASSERVRSTATKASEALGTYAQSEVAKFFHDLATEEKRDAGKFRVWTIALMCIGGIFAGIMLTIPSFGGSDYVHMIQRIVVTGAVFALAGYLARQSSHHRETANWAAALAVQLKTFEAYMDPIKSEEVRDKLRTTFALRAFGDPPSGKSESPSDPGVSPIMEKALELFSRSADKS